MTSSTFHRRHVLALGAAFAAAGLPLAANAQGATVKFILPNATGSGVDAITRAAAPALGKALNASVVVDNQPGAGGQDVATVEGGRGHVVSILMSEGLRPRRPAP